MGKALILVVRHQLPVISIDMNILDLLADAGGALILLTWNRLFSALHPAAKQGKWSLTCSPLAGRTENAPVIQRNDVCLSPEKKRVIVLGGALSRNLSLKRLAFGSGSHAGGLLMPDPGVLPSSVSPGRARDLAVDAYNAMMGRVGGDNPVLLGGDIVFMPEGRT